MLLRVTNSPLCRLRLITAVKDVACGITESWQMPHSRVEAIPRQLVHTLVSIEDFAASSTASLALCIPSLSCQRPDPAPKPILGAGTRTHSSKGHRPSKAANPKRNPPRRLHLIDYLASAKSPSIFLSQAIFSCKRSRYSIQQTGDPFVHLTNTRIALRTGGSVAFFRDRIFDSIFAGAVRTRYLKSPSIKASS
jgi:hypothetical protein